MAVDAGRDRSFLSLTLSVCSLSALPLVAASAIRHSSWSPSVFFFGRMDLTRALPDDLLIRILSFLPLKDAARTCVLSQRWRYLWMYLPSLDFRIPQLVACLNACYYQRAGVNIKVRKYVRWVNRVIRASQPLDIDCFRVRLYLNARDSRRIDSWFKYAVSKRASNVDLGCPDYYVLGHPHYVLVKMQPGFLSELKSAKSS